MKLEKKVHAVNEVQRLTLLNFAHIVPILKTFIGQQILLKSGNKSAKLQKALSFLKDEPKGFGDDYARLHWCMLDISNYSVWMKVSCSFKDTEHSCFYEKEEIYLGTMKDGVLTEIETETPKFETYNAEDVKTLMNEKKEVEDQLNTLKSKLRKFDGFFS